MVNQFQIFLTGVHDLHLGVILEIVRKGLPILDGQRIQQENLCPRSYLIQPGYWIKRIGTNKFRIQANAFFPSRDRVRQFLIRFNPKD
jgi:hypothetical protein